MYQQGVIIPSVSLQHTQIIHPAIPVEVKVVDHIPAGVQQLLKLTYAVRLRKCRSHGIKVQIERVVVVVGSDGNCLYGSHFRRRSGNTCRVNGTLRSHVLRRWCHCPDSCPATRQEKEQRYDVQCTKELIHSIMCFYSVLATSISSKDSSMSPT